MVSPVGCCCLKGTSSSLSLPATHRGRKEIVMSTIAAFKPIAVCYCQLRVLSSEEVMHLCQLARSKPSTLQFRVRGHAILFI
jgi:hypothetical protein